MEDALMNFLTTGKLSFADFAKSLIADMARIQLRGLLTDLGGGGSGGFGGLFAGLLQKVGGLGSGVAGNLSANANGFESLGSLAGHSITVNIHGSGDNPAEVRRAGGQAAREILGILSGARRDG